MRLSDDQRFFSKVHMTSECWTWQGTKLRGYGQFWIGGKTRRAHRVIYEQVVGPLTKGLQIDHLCKNPSCVRPDHLEAVTARVNTLRSDGPAAVNARKTHCPRGHPFAEHGRVNTFGSRYCKKCSALNASAYHAKKKDDPEYREKARLRAQRWYRTIGRQRKGVQNPRV